MTDDNEEADDTGVVQQEHPNDRMLTFGGERSTIWMRNIREDHHLDAIKDCIAVRAMTNSKGEDSIQYLVIVEDSFEWRDVEDCLPYSSSRELKKKSPLKVVH